MRELAGGDRQVTAFCETRSLPAAPFETRHPFEDERERFEWESWFNGVPTKIEQIVPTYTCGSLNDAAALRALAAYSPDLMLVFGTGVLKPPLIALRPDRILNFHGGDPERYRGLDTHLWAIYHREFCGLVATLHRLDGGIDTGDVVLQQPVTLTPRMGLHALRRATTEACVDLANAAIELLASTGAVSGRPQRERGRYYSAMPAVLKAVCKDRFESHTARLAGDPR